MDWIGVWLVVFTVFSFCVHVFKHGENTEINFFSFIISNIIMLPVWGRVFGWW